MNAKSIRSIVSFLALLSPLAAHAQKDVSVWLTTADRSSLFQEQTPLPFSAATPTNPAITVDPKQTYQTMDGFGYALTGGSAQLILKMDPTRRDALLHELFDTKGTSIGISYLRLTVGASDMNDHVFSYDDLPAGQTDPDMAKFSIDPDKADVIPIMKQILAIDPKIKIMASPWSAPVWMKTSGVARGGVLKPEYFAAYATYFVKYIQAMKAEGIDIDAITVQNEPLNEKNTPSMLMLDSEQDVFIRDNLGPAFKKVGIKTKIVLYDHNLDHPLYPLSILQDAKANRYIDGTGFHLYGGTVDAMTQVHNAFPKKDLYFTEQSVTSRPGSMYMGASRAEGHIIIGVSRNWSKNVLLWNLAADPNAGPHTNEGGCNGCYGAITIDGDTVTRNVAYYAIAHASKFVRPGAIRIDSNTTDTLPNVAFKTPDGKLVLIVSNPGTDSQTFDVHTKSKVFAATLAAGSVATYVW